MVRLSGFNYRQIVKKLSKLGFDFHRHAAGNHEIWWNDSTKLKVTIPNHPEDMPEGTLRAILKQANITPDEFLKTK
jgi:predicted RNA binding protein YcfA (HicA-like mRNA interferase family)